MSPIAPPVQTVLDLFSTDLADVRFGDLDGPSLARTADDVRVASDILAAAQLALDSARSTLHERQETLLHQVQRALAYARVYAEADAALSARLEAVALPRAARRSRADVAGVANDALVLTSEPSPARRPRGRPRKLSSPPPPQTEGPMLEGLAHAGE